MLSAACCSLAYRACDSALHEAALRVAAPRVFRARRCRSVVSREKRPAAGCEYYTNCAACAADTTCGWCARIDAAPPAGACARVAAAAPPAGERARWLTRTRARAQVWKRPVPRRRLRLHAAGRPQRACGLACARLFEEASLTSTALCPQDLNPFTRAATMGGGIGKVYATATVPPDGFGACVPASPASCFFA